MTREEIKQQYSMRDIVERYGFLVNRAGFIPCPFHHGDRQASMKIYPHDFHCFACGCNGDIFTFIQKMDGIDFKEAFESLGGTYEKETFSSRLAIYQAQKRVEMRKKEQKKKCDERKLNNLRIGAYRWGMEHNEPLSDAWCENYNALERELRWHEELMNER